jgi:hypothetical protein
MDEAQFLFLPEDIENQLTRLQSLRDALGDPKHEGVPSAAYPQARKSARQIYRVLANDHYPHLKELLSRIDQCIERGFRQPTLTRTRGRSNFKSALAELRAAEQFQGASWQVTSLETAREQEPVPEFLARKGDHAVVVEVYCPRTREGFDDAMDALKDRVMNLDLPWDYRTEISVDQLERFDESGKLLHLSPYELAARMRTTKTRGLVAGLVDELIQQLNAGNEQCAATRSDGELNLKVSVALTNVTSSTKHLPIRGGPLSYPGFSGYAPEAILDRLVRGGVRRKALKGQASGSSQAQDSLLIADLTCSDLADHLDQPSYREDFLSSVEQRLTDDRGGYDAILFCDSPSGSGLRGQVLVTAASASQTIEAVASDFGLPPDTTGDH